MKVIQAHLACLVYIISLTAALFTPSIKSQKFQGSPDIIYFEDTSKVAYLDKGSGTVYYSSNGGETYSQLDFEGVKIKYLVNHPFRPSHAFAISDDRTHFKTVSQGVIWKKFTTPERPAELANEDLLSTTKIPLSFHGKRSDYIIFEGACTSAAADDSTCERQFYYTVNAFDDVRALTKARACIFSDATPDLVSQDENLITCIVEDGSAGVILARSNNWFASKNYVSVGPGLVTDVSTLGAGSHYLLAVGSHFQEKDTTSVYVSYNGYDWDKVMFPSDVKLSKKFTIVESTSNEFFVDVKYPNSNVGQLYGSSVNGSYFYKNLDYTNGDSYGNVDFERVDGIAGVALANVVENGLATDSTPKIKSKITFDQGNSWNSLKTTNGEELSLHSIVQRFINNPNSPGKYYSSKVPGVLLGVGNIGNLKSYEEGDTYISLDAGLNWAKTLNGAHLFEFGDQGSIIVAIEDGADTNVFKYTTNQGKTWNQVSLDETIRAKLLTTTPDSTTFKFIVSGQLSNGGFKTYSLNFDGLYANKCGNGDFIDWYVKGVGSIEPICIDGYKQKFRRRISDANCKIDDEFNEPVVSKDVCPCKESDYVCAYNFIKDSNGKCIPGHQSVTSAGSQQAQCIANSEFYKEPSGYVLRNGNQCSQSDGVNIQQFVTKKCPNYVKETVGNDHSIIDYDEDDRPDETDKDNSNPSESEGEKKKAKEDMNDGRVKVSSFTFDGKITKYVYLERVPGSQLKDETLVVLTSHNQAFVTHDQGSSWEQIAPDEEFLDIVVNPHNNDHVYLLSPNQKIVYSTDRADNWKYFRTPAAHIPGLQPLQFHAKHSNWFIYTGQLGCDDLSLQGGCRTATYYTKSYGKRFAMLQEHVKSCEYIGHLLEPTDGQLIICQREENENTIHTSELLVSTDFFETTYEPLKDVIGFAQSGDYLVAATVQLDGSLKAHVSVNGMDWADAYFPSNFRVGQQQAYNILSSETKAIFLHVTTNNRDGSEFGTILKSNSNGTSYSLVLKNVNRDSFGFVDFEQMTALEGVAVVNVVSNALEAKKGSRKKLKTMITHNDGGQWDLLAPPAVDSTGKKYECSGKSIEECSLHIHGYTERADYRDTLSSGSAVGMMIGVGNVGDKLDSYLNGHTFLTRDGGVTWREVKKGVYQWEYGDQGSILVLVNGHDSTDSISYSIDEGATWNEHKFADHLVNVNDIATVPSDDSRKFLLFTKLPSNRGDKATVYQIDFSQLLKRKCSLDLVHPDTDDFDLWTPKHPHQSDNCLFGHEAQYYRKIPGKDCYIGEKLSEPYKVIRDCACTRQDYECDWNYERDINGECKLISGYEPPDHSLSCKVMNLDEYWLPTGYRRVPLSTCKGGREFDKAVAVACPGREAEFNEKHKGLHGVGLVMVIIFPILATAMLVYIIYHHYVGRYGQIRLGEEEVEFDNSSPFNKFTSVIGFVVVTSVSQVSNYSSAVIERAGAALDWVMHKMFKRSVSLDRVGLRSSSAEEAATPLQADTESPPGEFHDDILDDGDLTENEDERI